MVIHVDVACDTIDQTIRLSVLIQDIKGDIVAAMHGHNSLFISPLCVEARVILEVLRLAHKMEIRHVRSMSDSLNLILY